MFIYMCRCICTHATVYACIYRHIGNICTYIQTCRYICTHAWADVYACIYMYAGIYQVYMEITGWGQLSSSICLQLLF